MKTISLALATLLLAGFLYGQSAPSCKARPDLAGQCFRVHGRVRVVNGAGMVIWRIGTDRMLQVDDEVLPGNLSKALNKPGDAYGRDIFGDFEVCPLTKSRLGEMQMVCVDAASHLVIKDDTH